MSRACARQPRPASRTVLLAAGLGFALGLTACDGDPSGPPGEPQPGPVVQLLAPERVAPGQAVTLTGSNFGAERDAVAVTFGDRAGRVVSVEPDRIVALVPTDAPPGETRVELRVGGRPVFAGTLTVVLPGPPFTSVSAGAAFTCGIREGRGAFCWGSGARGALGTGQPGVASLVPLPVAGGRAFVHVSAGSAHACALDAAGAAFCWGRNDSGQLGNGGFGDVPTAAPVVGDLFFSAISAGFAHTCAVALDGRVHCWGANASGQLGDGSREDRVSPVAVVGEPRFENVSAGGTHSCARTPAGQAWCWGANGQGELGTGDRTDASVPAPVAGGLTFEAVVAGASPSVGLATVGDHTCGLTAGGAVHCWGFNGQGQLGDGSFASRDVPVAVSSGATFRAVSAGAFYTCGVTMDGRGLCWGQNDSNQLGTAATNPVLPLPVTVIGDLELTAVTAGEASKSVIESPRPHTCALDQSGAAFCWGSNREGQLGNGTVGVSSLPVPVAAN